MSQHQDSFNRSRGLALSQSKGFTLVEALVALALLTVGLVPAFIQATSAIALAGSVRNNLVAASLAAEGVEVVRALRDANWLADRPFATGLGGSSCDTGCRVEWNSDGVLPLAGNPTLKLDPVSGQYQYAGPSDSGFRREILITDESAYRLRVLVTMTWHERSGDKQFTLENHLYDWVQ